MEMEMEYYSRTLEIEVISAKDINLFSKKGVYVVVSLSGDDSHGKQKDKTTVNRDGSTNPSWNFPMAFTIDDDDDEESAAQQNRLTLDFKLCRKRSLLRRDKVIGKVKVPVKKLLNSLGDGNDSEQFVSYQLVGKPSEEPKGLLNISYKFTEKFVEEKKNEFGLGLGSELLEAALGGLCIGELLSEF